MQPIAFLHQKWGKYLWTDTVERKRLHILLKIFKIWTCWAMDGEPTWELLLTVNHIVLGEVGAISFVWLVGVLGASESHESLSYLYPFFKNVLVCMYPPTFVAFSSFYQFIAIHFSSPHPACLTLIWRRDNSTHKRLQQHSSIVGRSQA